MVVKDPIKNIMRLSEALDKISSYTQGLNYDTFVHNWVVIDACLMQLIIIGEMLAKIRSTFPQLHKLLPSQQAIGLRNLIVHTYHSVDTEEIRDIITHDLPKLRKALDEYKG